MIIIIYVFTDALQVAACWAERVKNSVSVEGGGRWNSTCFGQWECHDVENGGCVCVCQTEVSLRRNSGEPSVSLKLDSSHEL